jgi:hypothetical protein
LFGQGGNFKGKFYGSLQTEGIEELVVPVHLEWQAD